MGSMSERKKSNYNIKERQASSKILRRNKKYGHRRKDAQNCCINVYEERMKKKERPLMLLLVFISSIKSIINTFDHNENSAISK